MNTHDTRINFLLGSYFQTEKNLEMYIKALTDEAERILREHKEWGFFMSPTNYKLLGWAWSGNSNLSHLKTPDDIIIEVSRYEGMGNTSRGIQLGKDKIVLVIDQYVPYHSHMREAALNGVLRMLRGVKQIVDNGIPVELVFGQEQIMWHKNDLTITDRVDQYIRAQWAKRDDRSRPDEDTAGKH